MAFLGPKLWDSVLGLVRPARKWSYGEAATPNQWRAQREAQFQDSTDVLLYEIYGRLGPELASHFSELRSKAAKQYEVLRSIGQDVDFEIGKLAREEIAEAAVSMAWEPVARTMTLALLDYVVDPERIGIEQHLSSEEWAIATFKSTDLDRLSELAALSPDDCEIALVVAAASLSGRSPVVLRYRRRYLTLRGDSLFGGVHALCTTHEPAAFLSMHDVVHPPRGIEIKAGNVKYAYAVAAKDIAATTLMPAAWWNRMEPGSMPHSIAASSHPVGKLSFYETPSKARVMAAALPFGSNMEIHADAPLKFHRLADGYVVELDS